MKSLIITLFALLILSCVVLTAPSLVYATSGHDNNHDQNFCKQHPQDKQCKKDDDKNDCRKHPEKRECHVSVPEFGVIPGAIALVSSGGTFLFLKKRHIANR